MAAGSGETSRGERKVQWRARLMGDIELESRGSPTFMIMTRILAATLVAASLATAMPVAASTDVGPTGTSTTSARSVSVSSIPRGAIGPWKAARKVGRIKTVCARVRSTKYARYTSGKPTFLNLGRAFILSAVVRHGHEAAPTAAHLGRQRVVRLGPAVVPGQRKWVSRQPMKRCSSRTGIQEA
jgi:hypothetical protein